MANPEHLALVLKAEAWNKWRADYPDLVPDLREADLIWADLSGADLSGANLKGAKLG